MILTVSFLLLIILAFSLYFELVSENSGQYFPFFSLASSYYLIFYGIFPYYAASNVPHLPYDGNVGIKAALFTVVFVGFQFAGYFLAARSCKFEAGPAVSIATAALKLLSWSLMGTYFIIHFALQKYQIPSLPQLEKPFWYFAFSTLVYLLLQRQLTLLPVVVLAVAMISKLSINLVDGLLTPIIFDLLIVLSAALYLKSYRSVLVLVLVCLSLFGSYGYLKHFSRVVIKGELSNLYDFRPDLSLRSLKASIDSMARRSSHLLLIDHVIERTPSMVPFDQRNPLIDAMINHVPRVIWPSKPRETLGNSFGKRYGILNAKDMTTSWNLPWTVDFYITFGPALSVITIFIIGGVFGLGVRWLATRKDQPFWFGIYSAIVLPLFYQESNFSVMTGSVFSVLILLLVAYRVAKLIVPATRPVTV
ncbi:MAG TPA: hypothetical protein ENI69_07415 [Rhodospirillales bacterium]|nr:hypothetical protein [Rhodospirillales bacterium]